ncbi:MAG: choice-of-anchor tandem repeat GloVer-containing protein [Rhodospirillales bacterium]
MDSQGALFGTASTGGAAGSGVVFRLVPPTQAGGAWTETVLHDFTGDRDGGAPMAGLALMANGQLVGTASKGGANQFGVVFRLTPPKTEGGAWNQKVLHSFTGIAEGGFPVAAPVVFKHAVFGVAEPTTPQRVSDVFKLVP